MSPSLPIIPNEIMSEKILNIVFAIGAILLLISSVLVMENVAWGKYCFAAGVGLFVLSRSKMLYFGNDFRLKRLNRLHFLTTALLVICSTLQFKGNNSWIVLLLVVAVTEFYVSMRASSYEKSKAEEKKHSETAASDKSLEE
jgi:Ca2+/Na+ antiporter